MIKPPVQFVCLIALPLLTTFCLNSPSAYAESSSTEQRHNLHYVDYTPLKLGATGGGQPLIQMTINDTQKTTFLVDTGTSFTILSTELAKQMGLQLKPVVGPDGKPALFNGSKVMTTDVSALSLGTLKFKEVELVVLDSQAISVFPNKQNATPYSGILGSDILQRFAVFLDGPKHQFGICVPGGLTQHEAGLLGLTQPSVLPLTSSGIQNKWFVPVQFVNAGTSGSEDMLIDTGSNTTDVSEQLAQKIGLKQLARQGKKTAYGDITVANATTDELDLGDLRATNFPLIMRPVSDRLPPQLGMNFFSGYRVLMDFPAKKMYLQSNTATAVPKITVRPQTPGAAMGK